MIKPAHHCKNFCNKRRVLILCFIFCSKDMPSKMKLFAKNFINVNFLCNRIYILYDIKYSNTAGHQVHSKETNIKSSVLWILFRMITKIKSRMYLIQITHKSPWLIVLIFSKIIAMTSNRLIRSIRSN